MLTSPDLPGADLGETSDDVFAWEELPKSVAIIGAGYIAVELAGVLHALGVKTDLFVRGNRPLRRFDSYIVDGLMEEMEKQGLPLHPHKVPVRLTEGRKGQIRVYFEDQTSFVADHCDLGDWAQTKCPRPQSRSCRRHLK